MARTLHFNDFEKDVINKLVNTIGHPTNFQRHIQSLLRKGLIAYDDYSLAMFIKSKTMELIRMYDTNEDVLVARKSDYQNNNIGDGYFLVPKDEWFCEDDGLNCFHLFLTKMDGNRITLFLTSEGNLVVFSELPLSRRSDYVEI